tara:strand:+ start:4704 stop:6395 length:1692 start_codon:yes stop_codon:yes gene_type:complete
MPKGKDAIDIVKQRYVNGLYTTVRAEQKTDQEYIDDSFEVPEIHEPHHIYRAGLGQRIVDAPAEQIITSNPQVFFYPRSSSKTALASALKLSELVNSQWLPIIQKQNPNIFKEFIKAQLGRGEAFFRVSHNESWRKGDRIGIPVRFIVPESMVVYASPEEDDEGVPEQVVVYYQIQQFEDLIPKYPFLSGYDPRKGDVVTWWEYYNKETRYIEVGGVPVTQGGVQANAYGFTPFVRKLSGFGRRSPDGELANLIVSDLKRSRDLIREECAMRSNMASVMFLFAHKSKTLMTSGMVDVDKVREELSFGEYTLNVIQGVPPDTKFIESEIELSPEVFRRHSEIVTELNQRHPFIMAGFPWGTSGRQQDMTQTSAMRRYDATVENTEYAFATAIKQALRLCANIPNLRPEGILLNDLNTEYDIVVKLKVKDPIEEDRKITLGDRLWNSGNGSISLSKFHVDYQGMTEEESKKEIARILADQITIYNPDMAAVMGMVAAEEGGMADWLAKAQAQRQQLEQQPGIRQPLPRTGQERIQGETQTPSGREQGVAGMRGARMPPERFTRGR